MFILIISRFEEEKKMRSTQKKHENYRFRLASFNKTVALKTNPKKKTKKEAEFWLFLINQMDSLLVCFSIYLSSFQVKQNISFTL